MTIFMGSRYAGVPTQQVSDANGEKVTVFEVRPTTDSSRLQYGTEQAKSGDTFEALARKHYGDGNLWYVLADANPDIFWPLSLEAGSIIRIPPYLSAVMG